SARAAGAHSGRVIPRHGGLHAQSRAPRRTVGRLRDRPTARAAQGQGRRFSSPDHTRCHALKRMTRARCDDWPMLWNPLDPDLAVDPYPRYAALRDHDPVYFEEAFGWWFVTGHEEAMRVLREPGGEMRFLEFQQMRMGRDVSAEPYCRGLSRF